LPSMLPDGVQDALERLYAEILADLSEFHAHLSADDLVQLQEGQWWFIACQFIPMAWYYVVGPDRPAKFPATISHTMRRGPPKWIHHVCWLMAWWRCYSALSNHASDPLSQFFLFQMIVTGITAVFLFPVGVDAATDRVHFVSSLLYMIDHIIMFYYVGTTLPYRLAFYMSFAIMVVCFGIITRLEKQYGIASESDANAEIVNMQRRAMPPHAQRVMWWADLGKVRRFLCREVIAAQGSLGICASE